MNQNYLRDILDENNKLHNQIEDMKAERDNFKKALLQLLTTVIEILKDKSLSKLSKNKLQEVIAKVSKTIYR